MGNVVSGLQVGSFLILCMITWGRTEESKSEPRSVDAHRLTIEGQAWPGEGSPYGRLPARMQGQVRPELWQMGQYAADLSVRFISNSAGLGAAWDQMGTEENAYNLTGIAQSGMDLYVREGDEWMWIGQAVPTAGINQAPVLGEYDPRRDPGAHRALRTDLARRPPAGAHRAGREPAAWQGPVGCPPSPGRTLCAALICWRVCKRWSQRGRKICIS